MKMRRFRVGKDRELTLPADLTEGSHCTRLGPDETIDLEAARCDKHQRFLNNRVKLGDLTELDPPAPAPEPDDEPTSPRASAPPLPATPEPEPDLGKFAEVAAPSTPAKE